MGGGAAAAPKALDRANSMDGPTYMNQQSPPSTSSLGSRNLSLGAMPAPAAALNSRASITSQGALSGWVGVMTGDLPDRTLLMFQGITRDVRVFSTPGLSLAISRSVSGWMGGRSW